MNKNRFRRPPIEIPARIVSVKRWDKRSNGSLRIDLLFYRDRIVRLLRIGSQRIREALGRARTTELSVVKRPANIQQVVMDSRRELQEMSRTMRVTTLSPVPKTTVDKPPQHKPVTGSKPSSAKEPMLVRGKLLWFGESTRSLRGKQIEQYCVRVAVDELGGQSHPFYGADLERAVKDAEAKVGDRICLKQYGSVPVPIYDKQTDESGATKTVTRTVNKNLFEIEVLESATETASVNEHRGRQSRRGPERS